MRAILFDLDGTLTDTLSLVIAAINAALSPVWGGPRSEAEVRRLFGPPEGPLIAREAPDDPEALERFYRSYRRLHKTAARIFPGVRPMLSTLWERGLPLGLVTNKGRRSTLITLEEFGLRRFFRTIVDGDAVEHPKPAPDGILRALAELGTAGRDAAYVGDMPSDLVAAHAAGVAAWHAAWSRPEAAQEGWDFVARQPDDVLHRWLREAGAAT